MATGSKYVVEEFVPIFAVGYGQWMVKVADPDVREGRIICVCNDSPAQSGKAKAERIAALLELAEDIASEIMDGEIDPDTTDDPEPIEVILESEHAVECFGRWVATARMVLNGS